MEVGRGALQCKGWQILVHGAAVLAERSFAGNPMGAQGLLRGAAPQRELRNRRAREALLGAGRDRSGRAAGGRIRARLRRKAHARGRAPAAAALCEAIARRRLDAESQAAGPRALHVCGPPRWAGSLRRAR